MSVPHFKGVALSERTLEAVQAFLLNYLEERGYTFQPPASSPPGSHLHIHPTGSWFVMPTPESSGSYFRKFLGNSTSLPRIVKLLSSNRSTGKDIWLSNDQIFKAAWPDENLKDVKLPLRTIRINRAFKILNKTPFANLLEHSSEPNPKRIQHGFPDKNKGLGRYTLRRFKNFLNISSGVLETWPAAWPDLEAPGTPQYFKTTLLPGSPITSSSGHSFPFSMTKVDFARQKLFPGVPTKRGFVSLSVFATYVDDCPV